MQKSIKITKWSFAFFMMLIGLMACKQKSGYKGTKDGMQINGIDTNLKWVEYRIGEPPPVGYYDAFDSVIRKWDIKYERIEGGCEATTQERSVHEKDNPKYFKVLEKRFGKDWLDRFYTEVKYLSKKDSTKR